MSDKMPEGLNKEEQKSWANSIFLGSDGTRLVGVVRTHLHTIADLRTKAEKKDKTSVRCVKALDAMVEIMRRDRTGDPDQMLGDAWRDLVYKNACDTLKEIQDE